MAKTRDNFIPDGKVVRAVDLMLDSGAFSAWKRGEVIDREEYAAFLLRHWGLLDCYINLDVIPGRFGKPTSLVEVEQAAERSMENFNFLRDRGLEPMPVFHFGEGLDWLRKILDSGAGYIGLGGSVGKPRGERRRFFDACFSVINRHARKVRVHGFGTTSVRAMVEYPWHSVDSTTWVMIGANGAVLVPSGFGGSLNFLKPQIVRVTGKGDDKTQVAGFGDFTRAHFDQFIAGEGMSLARLHHDQSARNHLNIRCMVEAARRAEVVMVFSTWLLEVNHQANVLTAAGARNRLVSYYEVRGYEPMLLPYVQDGVPKPPSLERRPTRLFKNQAYRGKRVEQLVRRAEASHG